MSGSSGLPESLRSQVYRARFRHPALERRRRRQITQPDRSWFECCADHEHLLPHFHCLKREAGQAPGIDDLTYADVGRSEAAALMRDLARSIRDGSYRPLPPREVPIPRHGRPNDPRILRLRGILDRVVATAVNDFVAPVLDRDLPSFIYAFRRRRNALMMLADMEVTMVTQSRCVLAVDDIYKAFDHTIIADSMSDMLRYISCPRMLSLIEVILKGGDEQRTIGIDQGSALSPAIMTERLHSVMDQPSNTEPAHPPQLRYADNLAYLCRDVSEAGRALAHAAELLAPAGMRLKGVGGGIADLRQGETIQVLGFGVGLLNDRVTYTPGEEAWDHLTQHLMDAHKTANPPDTARMVVRGWFGALGPTFESASATQTLDRVYRVAAHAGFRELDPPETLLFHWQASHQRWLECRETTWVRHRASQIERRE